MIKNKGEAAKEKKRGEREFQNNKQILKYRFLTFSNLRTTSNLTGTAA